MERLRAKISALYGEDRADSIYQQIMTLLGERSKAPLDRLALSERDAVVIAYGDHVRRSGEPPLQTLQRVLHDLDLPASSLHILPFYPYSSDDGFSVIDYTAVDPALGTWADIQRLADDYRLMFDAVFNHVSVRSAWFAGFLRGEAPYTDYFVTAPPEADLSLVTRPRTHPVLTRFDTANGARYVWTTFSADQVDVNAANPEVLIELIRVLLFYIEQGAQLIRLDAIAFLWKEIGTTCVHLPNTHRIVQVFRDVLDLVSPAAILITETNVPHHENLSYFGDGIDEAQMVYQFALPPLIYHTMRTGEAAKLTEWAKTITRVSDRTTFFNFTASHDGIGVRPVTGILSDDEIAALVQTTLSHGGHVSMKSNPDGTQSPYELNITYFDAITSPRITAAQPQIAVDRFMVSQAIMLAMIGVPGIYLHSLLGSQNDHEGVKATGHFRSINREKLDADALLEALQREGTIRHGVFERYKHLLAVRAQEPAFHPLGDQTVLDLHPEVFALERTAPDDRSRVIALNNVGSAHLTVMLPEVGRWIDLLSGETFSGEAAIPLQPYQVRWLKRE